MLTTNKSKINFADIAERVAARKADSNLRHIPNEHDLRVASEHARLMVYPQVQAITAKEKTEHELQAW